MGRRGIKEYRAPEALALIAADREHVPLVCPSCGTRSIVRAPRRRGSRAGAVPLAQIEVDAARPEPQGFTLTGQGPDHAEYQLDLRFEMPLDPRTRTVLGELLSHSDLTISRRAPGGSALAQALRQRRNRAPQR